MGHAHSKTKNFDDWYEKLHQCQGHNLPVPPFRECDHYLTDCPNTSGCPYDCAECTTLRIALKNPKQEDFWQSLIARSLSKVDLPNTNKAKLPSKVTLPPRVDSLSKDIPQLFVNGRRHSVGEIEVVEDETVRLENEEQKKKKFGTVGHRGSHLPRLSLGFNFLAEMGVEDMREVRDGVH